MLDAARAKRKLRQLPEEPVDPWADEKPPICPYCMEWQQDCRCGEPDDQ